MVLKSKLGGMGELLLRMSPSPKEQAAIKDPILLFVGGAERHTSNY